MNGTSGFRLAHDNGEGRRQFRCARSVDERVTASWSLDESAVAAGDSAGTTQESFTQ